MKGSSDQYHDLLCGVIEKNFLVPSYFLDIQGEQ